jgi:hypothetical protein
MRFSTANGIVRRPFVAREPYAPMRRSTHERHLPASVLAMT